MRDALTLPLQCALRRATLEDAALIAPQVRPEDRREIHRCALGDVEASLRLSILSSDEALAFTENSQPIALLGIGTSRIGGVATPWLIGTSALARHRKFFLRASKIWTAELRRTYPYLSNWVDPDYRGAVRWLQWLGFTLEKPQPIGRYGAPLQYFWMKGTASCAF